MVTYASIGGEIVSREDNYFELMPAEQRELTANYSRKLLGGAPSHVQVDGWNLAQ